MALGMSGDLWSHVLRGQRVPSGAVGEASEDQQSQGGDHEGRAGPQDGTSGPQPRGLALGWLVVPAVAGAEGSGGERTGCCGNVAREGHCALRGRGQALGFPSRNGHHAVCFTGPSIDITNASCVGARGPAGCGEADGPLQPSPRTPITSTPSLHIPESCWSPLQNGIKMTTFSHCACEFPEPDFPLKARTPRLSQARVSRLSPPASVAWKKQQAPRRWVLCGSQCPSVSPQVSPLGQMANG